MLFSVPNCPHLISVNAKYLRYKGACHDRQTDPLDVSCVYDKNNSLILRFKCVLSFYILQSMSCFIFTIFSTSFVLFAVLL